MSILPSEKISISQFTDDDKPREKFLLKGVSALSDSELIAILLRTGNRNESVLDLSKRVLALSKNSLNELSNISIDQLLKINGIGKTKAITMMVAFELGRRCRAEKISQKKQILSPQDLYEFMQDKNVALGHEEFWSIFVNQSSSILCADKIGKGGLTSTTCDVRLIMRKAISICATGIFVCHNHPSGKTVPSRIDISLTKEISKACDVLSVKLLDHIIVSREGYYSFLENNLL